MATTVVMPPLGESVLEGTVGKWLVSVGQRVERDQPIVEILTDKTDSEIPAPTGGVVTALLANEGDTVPVGQGLMEIDESASGGVAVNHQPAAEAPAPAASPAVASPAAATPAAGSSGSASTASETSNGGAPPASPAVRKLARELDVDLGKLQGSGQAGVITREDVMRQAKPAAEPPRAATPPPAATAPRPAAAPRPAPAVMSAGSAPLGLSEALRVLGGQSSFKVPPYQESPGDKTVPFSRRRRITADHMVYSKLSSPHVVTFSECDLSKTSKLRDEHKNALKKDGVNLTFLAFVVSATARALRENPVMNSRILEDAFVQLKSINLGIAVETEEGLVVPVIRNADELTVRGLARAIDEIATKARDNKLTPDDLAGKTFCVSNPGRKGNLVGGAIISQPNVGILRIGEIKKRAVVVEHEGQDVIAIHPVMYMALSYDHRVVDGVVANGFLYRVNELLELGDFEI